MLLNNYYSRINSKRDSLKGRSKGAKHNSFKSNQFSHIIVISSITFNTNERRLN